jgi:predicted nucleic acid-binding protein
VSVRRTPKFVVDTNLFINGFRQRDAADAFERFHHGCAPFEYLSVVVAQELRSGVRRSSDLKVLERNVLSLYERAGRIITPSADAWHRSGDVLAAMSKREGLELTRVSTAFANDILLAASCRESGCVLITENVRDFSRIRRFLAFEFTEPWPGAAQGR